MLPLPHSVRLGRRSTVLSYAGSARLYFISYFRYQHHQIGSIYNGNALRDLL